MKKLKVIIALALVVLLSTTIIGCNKTEGSKGLGYSGDRQDKLSWEVHLGECTEKKIIIPPTFHDRPVITIGDFRTLVGDSRIVSVTIPSSVTRINKAAFAKCKNLESITIPDSVTSIGENAFSCCEKLESITIPQGVSLIEAYTFAGCINLTSVTIGANVTKIRGNAFYDCPALKDVYYAGTEAEWNAITIAEGNEALLNATIHFNSKN